MDQYLNFERMAEQDRVEIVRLPPEQWRAYKDLRLEALKNEPQAFGSSYAGSLNIPDADWRTRLENAARGKGHWLLFAREKDALVGMIGAFIEDAPGIAMIVSVYVAKAARGRGISKKLMTAILAELTRSQSVETARLTVNKDQFAAVALYRGFGFKVLREEEAAMGDGKSYIEYVMEKPLKC